jgi:hypothetical protein
VDEKPKFDLSLIDRETKINMAMLGFSCLAVGGVIGAFVGATTIAAREERIRETTIIEVDNNGIVPPIFVSGRSIEEACEWASQRPGVPVRGPIMVADEFEACRKTLYEQNRGVKTKVGYTPRRIVLNLNNISALEKKSPPPPATPGTLRLPPK